jgi:hypothetical protein
MTPVAFAPAPTFPDSDCPCISVAQLLSTTAPWLLEASVPDGICDGWSDRSGKCLPADYGSAQCLQWDSTEVRSTVSTECEYDIPAWCYVDSRACSSRQHSAATYRYRGRSIPLNASLGHSYGTCGYTDTFGRYNSQILKQLRALTLRVTLPDVANPTPHFWRRDSTGALTPSGHVVEGPVWESEPAGTRTPVCVHSTWSGPCLLARSGETL